MLAKFHKYANIKGLGGPMGNNINPPKQAYTLLEAHSTPEYLYHAIVKKSHDLCETEFKDLEYPPSHKPLVKNKFQM